MRETRRAVCGSPLTLQSGWKANTGAGFQPFSL
jgi:hypothetical protein